VSDYQGTAPEPAGVPVDGVPLAYRAVRGGIWVALSSWWTIVVGFIANIALTRMLAPEAFGVFALAMFFAQVLRVQPRLGLGYAYGQHPRTDGETLGTFLAMDLGAAAAGLALILAAMPVLLALGYEALTVRVAVLLGLAATVESVTNTGVTLLEKELRFGQVSLVQAAMFPLSYAPAIWLAVHGEGVWSLVAQNVTYSVLYLAGVAGLLVSERRCLPGLPWGFSGHLAREFLRFGAGVGLGLLGVTLLTQVDNLLVGSLAGVTALGYYDRAYRTAQWPSTLLNALIARTGFNTYAHLQDDPERLGRALGMMVWLIAALALPVALGVFAAAPDLLTLLYGERWLPSAPYLRVLALVAGARPLVDNANALFAAVGKPWLAARLSGAQVVVLAVAGLPLVWRFGALGACVAVALAAGVGLFLVIRRLEAVSPGAPQELLMPALAAVLSLMGTLAVCALPQVGALVPAARVVVKAGCAVALFVAALGVAQPRQARERVAYVWRLARAGRG